MNLAEYHLEGTGLPNTKQWYLSFGNAHYTIITIDEYIKYDNNILHPVHTCIQDVACKFITKVMNGQINTGTMMQNTILLHNLNWTPKTTSKYWWWGSVKLAPIMVTQCWNILEHEYDLLVTSPRPLFYLPHFKLLNIMLYKILLRDVI